MSNHHAIVDEAICSLVNRTIPQRVLLVKEPPRHGKSEHLCHWTPPWYLNHFPESQVIMTGYSDRFAKKWGRRARETFKETMGIWGNAINPAKQSAVDWATTQGGGMLSAGLGGGINGEGAGLLICDDLIKNSRDAQSESFRDNTWEWFLSTAWTRLAPDGVCVMIGTCWHRDDHLARIKQEFGNDVLEINLPAIAEENDHLGREPGKALWPERWSLSFLEDQKRKLGPYLWNALYRQKPSQHEEAEWPQHYFDDVWVRMIPNPQDIAFRVLALDPSMGKTDKADFSAYIKITAMHDGMVYVDADLQRRDVKQIVDDGLYHCREFEPDAWGVEVNGFAALAELIYARSEGVLPPLAKVTQHSNKLARIRLGVGPMLANGKIKFIEGNPGTQRLVSQLKDFPLADHDDGPDALELGLRVTRSLQNGSHIEEEEPTRVLA